MMPTVDEEISRLRTEGIRADQLIWVSHHFSHFDASDAGMRACCAALRQAGFGGRDEADLGSDEEIDGSGRFHYWAFTLLPATREALLDADTRASEVAHEHGARYDRWLIMRDARTGRLIDVEADADQVRRMVESDRT